MWCVVSSYQMTDIYTGCTTSSCIKTYANCAISIVTTGTVGTLSFLTEFRNAVAF